MPNQKSKEDYQTNITLLLEEFRLLVNDNASEVVKKAKGNELFAEVDGLICQTDAARDADYLDYIDQCLDMFDPINKAILAAHWAIQADTFLTADALDNNAMLSKMAAFRAITSPECMLYRDNVPEVKAMFETEHLGEELLRFQSHTIFQSMKDEQGQIRPSHSHQFGLN